MLQYYLWRWGIEVNFREEKPLIGTGQAQVRGEAFNQHLPAMTVAAYAMLWTAALQLHQRLGTDQKPMAILQPPRRRTRRHPDNNASALPSTGDLLRRLRYETWAGALRPGSLCHFVAQAQPRKTCHKPLHTPTASLPGGLFAAA